MTNLLPFLKYLSPSGRKAIYTATASVFGILVIFGVIDATESGRWLEILDKALGFLGSMLALANVEKAPDAIETE